MSAPREKFQALLRELFQIQDAAELDFGIYRIMGQKRGLIEKFIDEELLASIDAELRTGSLKKESAASAQVEELAAQIRETLADDAIDAERNLDAAYAKTKLGRDYLAAQKASSGGRSMAELEGTIYNHLYDFFSRYYDKGDFMSLRRYSKREKYAIPYNGEEVHLHWANADQYYIKTGENFTDYRWKDPAGTVRVKFAITRADVPKDNIKAPDKRHFIPQLDEIEVETVGKARDKHRHVLLTVPFHYRGLTEEETDRYGALADERGIKNGSANGGKLQAAILAEAVDELPKAKAVKASRELLATLAAEHHKDADGNPVSWLAHHLRRFAASNTSDYFIHKDLGGFLTRELDFFLKNEVLHLDNLEAGDEERAEGWFEMMRVIRRIGSNIIDFLAQIENFQKRLFEKKKFVTECHYCLTLDRIPEELYPEIAKNKAQVEEWKRLFAIQDVEGWSEPPTTPFLKKNRNLVLDTGLFEAGTADELMAAIEHQPGYPVSMLIKGESFQGLSLAMATLRESVACVYSDPPYNTGKDEFIYKDTLPSSSWLTMANDRIALAREVISNKGVGFWSIDDNERHNLEVLLERMFGCGNRIANMVWKGATDNNPTRVAVEHEYILCWAKSLADCAPEWKDASDETKAVMLQEYKRLKRRLSDPEKIQKAFREWIKENKEGLQPLTHYDRVDEDGVYTGSRKVHNPGKEGYRYDVFHPTTKKACKQPARGYRYPETRMKELLAADKILFGKDHKQIIQIKEYLDEYRGSLKGIIELDSRTGANALESLFGSREVFKNPKPSSLLETLFAYTVGPSGLVVDFTAGSGTSGEAVVNLNRKDGGDRRLVLIEFGDHFDDVLKGRISKRVYSSDWKSGKPTTRDTGISHCFKYLRLESYEDALGNIAFDENEAAQRQLAFNQYVIHYMLDFETSGSETLLNTEKLVAPFDYKLEIREGDEVKVKPVDLPETFNFLIGLRVRTRRVYEREVKRGRKKDKIKYLVLRGRTNQHATGGEREVVVIWRTTEGWKKEDYTADRKFIEELELTKDADEVFYNDDSFLRHPNSKSLDPVFKRRMFNQPD